MLGFLMFSQTKRIARSRRPVKSLPDGVLQRATCASLLYELGTRAFSCIHSKEDGCGFGSISICHEIVDCAGYRILIVLHILSAFLVEMNLDSRQRFRACSGGRSAIFILVSTLGLGHAVFL